MLWKKHNTGIIQLLQEPPYAKDTRLAETQLRFGIMFGASQEFVFPWYQRGQSAFAPTIILRTM